MKRRKTKKSVRRVEHSVEQEFGALLRDPTSSELRARLNSALVSLIAVTLQLNYSEHAKYWWTDDLEWSEALSHASQLKVRGRIWWGRRSEPSSEMVSTPFQAMLGLNPSGRRLKYSVTFGDDGSAFVLRNRGA
jgi:hypothetical protein